MSSAKKIKHSEEPFKNGIEVLPNTDNMDKCSLLSGIYYRRVIYTELGLCDADVTFEIETPELDMPGKIQMPLISEDKVGNIVFTPCNLKRELWQIQDAKTKRPKTHTYSITRYAEPDEHNGQRYSFPSASLFPAQMPMICPKTILAFEQKSKIKTLIITEGYKKAWAASIHCHWHCIGISSITHGTDKQIGAMYDDVMQLIKICQIERVVILFDGDAVKCKPEHVSEQRDLSWRAKTFIAEIVRMRDCLSDSSCELYFAYINSDVCEGAKGLDDMIIWAKQTDLLEAVCGDFEKYNGKGHYIIKTNITHSTNSLKKTFGLDDVQAYYNMNASTIGQQEFLFAKQKWQYDELRQTLIKIELDYHEEIRRSYGLPPKLPIEQIDCFKAYDFYCNNNCLFAIRRNQQGYSFVQISNFKLESLYLIKGVKRIFKITNELNQEETIELQITDMQSKNNLSAATANYGNFVFWGNAMDLANLQRYLFSKETPSLEIARLGHHANGFWTWCNGIWDYAEKRFLNVDDHGMVAHGDSSKRWYYIPASTSNEATMEDWGSLTKFKYESGTITFADWADLYYQAYGDNGMVGIAFLIMTCFRDIVIAQTRCSPMLFLFGQRGSGKSELAKSLLWLFGTGQDALSLEAGSTPKSFTRLLRQKTNATLLLDEWKNHLDKMIGPVKGIWDGYMSGRAAFSNDDRTKDATLYSTAIVAGQEMPNIEPALYSRFVLLNFDKSKFSEAQTKAYQELQKMQARGLTPVTHEILSIREKYKELFLDNFVELNNMSRQAYRQSETIDRVLKNNDILGTSIFIAIEAGLKLPFSFEDYLAYTNKLIVQQTHLMSTSDEVRQFFAVLPTLIKNKKISQDIDYTIVGNELRLRLSCIVGEYKKEMASQRANALDEGTLSSYMRTHSAFIAHKTAKFSGKATTAYIFDYEKLNQMYDLNLELVGAMSDNLDL